MQPMDGCQRREEPRRADAVRLSTGDPRLRIVIREEATDVELR